MSYLARFGKTFTKKGDLEKHYAIFKQNYYMIEEHNKKEGASFKMELNEYADREII